jgi:hypothetical protein
MCGHEGAVLGTRFAVAAHAHEPFPPVTEACDFCVRACLLQAGHPVACTAENCLPPSVTVTLEHKSRWLERIHALKVWRCYLAGRGDGR